jgi:DNA-binding NarL/FixJ family response regulator
MFQRGWFHIDVRQTDLLTELAPAVRQYGPTRSGPLNPQVIEELVQPGRFAGVIVQVDEENLGALEQLSVRMPGLPILALLGPRQREQLNALSARGISCVLLPLQGALVVNFVQRALTHNFVPNERVASTIAQLAEKRALTAREVQLVSYCLGDEPRARVRRRLGITENTLKSQIRGLLRKCGERNLDSLAKNVLRTSLLSYALPEPPGDTTQESAFLWAMPAE